MRTEAAILDQHGSNIIAAIRPDHIIELGAGTSRKTEALLAPCEHAGLEATYWPYDVCEGVLHQTGARLLNKYHSWLRVEALMGDYTAGLAHLPRP